jgi:hypothetical protein
MKSPFPGMDPYLESRWRDVHTSLIRYSADELNAHLPRPLLARAEERIAVESDDDEVQFAPDVGILEGVSRDWPPGFAPGLEGAAVAPYRLVTVVEQMTERYIKIIDAKSHRLVTVIEFLSPTNKLGKGLDAFKRKRDMLCAGKVNVVEVDLVRHGNWRKVLAPHKPPEGVESAYRAMIRIARDPIAVHFQPISLREPLPAIKIPLRATDQPVELQLQPLIERAYEIGRYAEEIDYLEPCEPPLSSEDDAWADQLLRTAGIRQAS